MLRSTQQISSEVGSPFTLAFNCQKVFRLERTGSLSSTSGLSCHWKIPVADSWCVAVWASVCVRVYRSANHQPARFRAECYEDYRAVSCRVKVTFTIGGRCWGEASIAIDLSGADLNRADLIIDLNWAISQWPVSTMVSSRNKSWNPIGCLIIYLIIWLLLFLSSDLKKKITR